MQEHHRPRPLGFHPNAPTVVRFDPFRLDLADGSLWRDDEEVRLPPRALVILQHLVERAGRIVPKQALLDAAWKDAYVSETSLTEVIGIIRQALGDDPQKPRYIQTVHRRGYRFIAPIAIDAAASAPPPVIELARTPAEETATAGPALKQPEQEPHEQSADSRPQTRVRSRRQLLALGAAAAALVITIATALWLVPRGATHGEPVVRLSLTLPPDQAPAPGLNSHPVAAISPDGTRIVYVGGTPEASHLFVRRMDQFSATPIAGTEDAHGPFISPDGRTVAFFAEGKLKIADIDRGDPHVICATPTGVGGVWLSNDEIVFAPDWTTPVMRVRASGGEPAMAAAPPEGTSYRWPDRLDDHTIIVTRWRSSARDAAVVAVDLKTGVETMVAERAGFGRYAASGHVVFVRDGAVFAVRVDSTTHAAIGPPVQVADAVLTGATGAAQLAIAPNGTLLYIVDTPERSHRILSMVDAAGHATDLPIAARTFRYLAVCGNRLAATIYERGQSDLWTGSLDRAALTRETSAGSTYDPIWSPDCSTLTFAWNRTGIAAMYSLRIGSGVAPTQLLETRDTQFPGSWSSDGKKMAFMQMNARTGADVWLLERMESVGRLDRAPSPPAASPKREGVLASAASQVSTRPILAVPGEQIVPRLSPDGRWVAYESDSSGPFEVEVASVENGSRLQISNRGGTWPFWSADGRVLFYLDKGTIYRVPLSVNGGELTPGNPAVAYADPDIITFRMAGSGLLIVRRTNEHLPLSRLDLVLNWFTELQQHVR